MALSFVGHQEAKMNESASIPTDLIVQVTKRLFLAIFILLLVALGIMTFAVVSKSDLVVPAVVVISGFIGGFVGLQRRIKDLTVPDLELISKSQIYTWLSPLVGGVLALLLYILFCPNYCQAICSLTFKQIPLQVKTSDFRPFSNSPQNRIKITQS